MHITYQGMHSYALRSPEATWNFTCPVRWNLQQQTVWPRGVVSSATESDLFCHITSSDFEVFRAQAAGFRVLPFVSTFLNRAAAPLKPSPNYLLLWSQAGTDVAHDSGPLKGFIKSLFFFFFLLLEHAQSWQPCSQVRCTFGRRSPLIDFFFLLFCFFAFWRGLLNLNDIDLFIELLSSKQDSTWVSILLIS